MQYARKRREEFDGGDAVRPQGATPGLGQEQGKVVGGGSGTLHGHPGDVPVQEIAGPGDGDPVPGGEHDGRDRVEREEVFEELPQVPQAGERMQVGGPIFIPDGHLPGSGVVLHSQREHRSVTSPVLRQSLPISVFGGKPRSVLSTLPPFLPGHSGGEPRPARGDVRGQGTRGRG